MKDILGECLLPQLGTEKELWPSALCPATMLGFRQAFALAFPCRFHVVDGFEEAASVCTQVCGALSLPLEDLHRALPPSRRTPSQQRDEEVDHGRGGERPSDPVPLPSAPTELLNATEEDEFSWFFDGPVTSSTIPTASAPPVLQRKEGGTSHSFGSPVIRHEDVASWLQAHSPSDYSTTLDVTHPVFATLTSPAQTSHTNVESDGLSLPMRLAAIACPLSAPSQASPIIQRVIGPSASSSQVIFQSVLIPIHPHQRSQVGDLLARKVGASGGEGWPGRARFHHVVCLLDNFCFPGGVSEAAESCKPSALLTSDCKQPFGLRRMGQPDRPSAVVSLLQRYDVDLLCAQGPLEEEVRQACANAGILVLTDLRKAEAEAVSKLSGCQAVEDLSDFQGIPVGSAPVYGVMVEAGWTGPCDDRFFGVARAAVGACLPEMSLLLTGDFTTAGVPPTILLTAPTPFMATALEERVISCLAQLTDCMVGGKAVVGLGLVEVVSLLLLERMADESEEEEEGRGAVTAEAPRGHLYRPSILRGFAGALRDFLLERLMLVSGVSFDGAMTALNKAAMGVQRLLEHRGGGIVKSSPAALQVAQSDCLPSGLIRALMDQCAMMGEGREVAPWPLIESPRAKEASYGEVVRLVSRLARLVE